LIAAIQTEATFGLLVFRVISRSNHSNYCQSHSNWARANSRQMAAV